MDVKTFLTELLSFLADNDFVEDIDLKIEDENLIVFHRLQHHDEAYK